MLETADAHVALSADLVITPRGTLQNVDLGLELVDGRLRLDPLGFEGYGGEATFELTLDPLEQGYRVYALGAARHARLNILRHAGDPAQTPPLDIDLEFEASGNTLQQMVASGSGFLTITQGSSCKMAWRQSGRWPYAPTR